MINSDAIERLELAVVTRQTLNSTGGNGIYRRRRWFVTAYGKSVPGADISIFWFF
ncbi:MAG: hypothetical protein ACI9ON_003064 [Limisphaerales bacterium]|jgi:hypothetical protein